MVLPHPNTLSATAPEFVSLYIPSNFQKKHDSHMTVQAHKQAIEKWDGKPHKFKTFLIAMNAAAANTPPRLCSLYLE
jgi:hypothetical protein